MFENKKVSQDSKDSMDSMDNLIPDDEGACIQNKDSAL